MKIGHFSISFADLQVPVAGLPITVTRTYDTRQRHKPLDFGQGWSVDYQSVRIQESRRPGFAWELKSYPSGPLGVIPNWCVESALGNVVSVTMPDGEVEKFRAVAFPECNQGVAIFDVELRFVPIDGSEGSLVAVNDNVGRLLNQKLVDPGDPSRPIDPSRYVYTNAEGQDFTVDQGFTVREIHEHAGGNTVTFDEAGVIHSAGLSILFVRDAQDRIVKVIAPDLSEISYEYDTAGNLVAVIDANGGRTEFSYLAGHYLEDIIDPRGVRVSRNEYDDDGRLVAVIDADGHRIEYSRDIDGRVEQVRDRNGVLSTYVYNERGDVLAETNGAGETTLRSYDGNGNTLTETNPLGDTRAWTYDGLGNVLTETDPEGGVTTHVYGAFNQLQSTTDANGVVALTSHYRNQTIAGVPIYPGPLERLTDANGHSTWFAYDAATGELSTLTDAAGAVTRFEVDGNGFKTAEVDALGQRTEYLNDAMGRVLSQTQTRTNAQGQQETLVTAYSYDAKGNVTAVTHPDGSVSTTSYDGNDKPLQECDALNRCTLTTYDARGNVTRTDYADGSFETKTYDANGNQISETDRNGVTTKMVYDAANRLIETIYPDAAGDDGNDGNNPRSRTEYDAANRVVAQVDRMGARTTFAYDAAGRRTATTDAEGHTGTTAFDASGRRVATVDADGHRTAFHYDAGGRLTETEFANSSRAFTEYDAVGRKTASVAQDGQRSEYGYDPLGRLTEVRQFIDGRTLTTRYRYDELGNKIEQVDALGRTTRWEFDAMGRETARILPSGERETKVYNAVGELIEATDFNGVTTRYSYDLGGRLLRADYFAAGSSVAERSEAHAYDAAGNRVSMASPEGITTWVHDAERRVVCETQPNGALIEYTFDGNGNRTLTRHTQGSAVTENRYTFDALNRLESAQVGNGVPTVYVYNAAGNLTEELQGSAHTAYAYDALHRLIEIHSTTGGATTQRYVYSLDAAGRRTRMEEVDATGITRITDYGYDALGRLTSEVETVAGVETHRSAYTHDDVGNRVSITEDGITRVATFDQNDRLLTQGDHSYDYDANGSQTRKQSAEGIVDYLYDTRSKLIEASASSGLRVRFDYDAEGNRIARRIRPTATASEIETRFVIDRSFGLPELIAKLDAAGTITARYLHGYHLIQQSETVGANSVLRYPLRDGLGSSRYLVDDAGSVTDAIRFTPWGETRALEGDAVLTHRFAGEAWEESVGLSYNRARWLDPATGRFTQTDKWSGSPTAPITLNKYVYGNSDSINHVDPSGHIALIDLMSGINIQALGRTVSAHTLRRYVRRVVSQTIRDVGSARREVRKCMTSMRSCDLDVPVLIVGGTHPEMADHILDAQSAAGNNYLPAGFLHSFNARVHTPWYIGQPGCSFADLAIAVTKYGPSVDCDEFPMNAMDLGGSRNHPLFVSLRYVPGAQNKSIGGMWLQLVNASGMRADPNKKALVVAWREIPLSVWLPNK